MPDPTTAPERVVDADVFDRPERKAVPIGGSFGSAVLMLEDACLSDTNGRAVILTHDEYDRLVRPNRPESDPSERVREIRAQLEVATTGPVFDFIVSAPANIEWLLDENAREKRRWADLREAMVEIHKLSNGEGRRTGDANWAHVASRAARSLNAFDCATQSEASNDAAMFDWWIKHVSSHGGQDGKHVVVRWSLRTPWNDQEPHSFTEATTYRDAIRNAMKESAAARFIETQCAKVPHVGAGYLHDAEDDRPYDVDGVAYCGRCHLAMAAHYQSRSSAGINASEGPNG